MDVQGVSLSTTCTLYLGRALDISFITTNTSSMDVQDESLSTASCMDVQEVFIFEASRMEMHGVSLSTVSSMDVQGVYPLLRQ
jgi:hypothetical protein